METSNETMNVNYIFTSGPPGKPGPSGNDPKYFQHDPFLMIGPRGPIGPVGPYGNCKAATPGK